MGMGISSGFAAGAGADSLQEVLRRKFAEAVQQQQLAQEAQRIKIAEQAQADNTAYRNESLKSLQDERATSAQLRRNASGKPPSTGITCPVVLAL